MAKIKIYDDRLTVEVGSLMHELTAKQCKGKSTRTAIFAFLDEVDDDRDEITNAIFEAVNEWTQDGGRADGED